MKKKGIGLVGMDIKKPSKACDDKNCPFHGKVGVRGRIFTGTVISDKMAKSVTVAWTRRLHVPKYERYEKKKSKVSAHNPECINAKKGDVVKIAETRPLSKTKHFVVIEVLGQKSIKDALKDETIEETGVRVEQVKDKPKAEAKPETKPKVETKPKPEGKKEQKVQKDASKEAKIETDDKK